MLGDYSSIPLVHNKRQTLGDYSERVAIGYVVN